MTGDVGPARRVAVVTGAAQGLGKAIAGRFVTDGFNVVFADLNEAAAENAAHASDPTETEVVAVELPGHLAEGVLADLQRCASLNTLNLTYAIAWHYDFGLLGSPVKYYVIDHQYVPISVEAPRLQRLQDALPGVNVVVIEKKRVDTYRGLVLDVF